MLANYLDAPCHDFKFGICTVQFLDELHRVVWELPYMMSASEGGNGKEDVVREVVYILYSCIKEL